MILGAGIVGCSVAEHLSRLGWRDVVVLDQGPLFESRRVHLPRSRAHVPDQPIQDGRRPAKYSVGRYMELEVDGQPCGYQVGGIEVAETPERLA